MDYKKFIEKRNAPGNFGSDIGAKIIEVNEGYAYGELVIERLHKNVIGSVQGGVIFTFADVVGAAATMAYGYQTTTLNATINFLNAAIGIEKLVGKAREIKHGKTTMVIVVDVYDEKENHIAYATFTYYNLKKKIILDEENS